MNGLRRTHRYKAAAFTALEAVAGVTQPAILYAAANP